MVDWILMLCSGHWLQHYQDKTIGFCLTNLFYWRVLQTPGPPTASEAEPLGISKTGFLQAKCPSCRLPIVSSTEWERLKDT